jgi:hypothetical protein
MTRAETFSATLCRWHDTHPAKAEPPAGTECCAGSGDGNTKRTQGARGPCIEPRNESHRGGRRRGHGGRQYSRAKGSVVPESSSGVVRPGHACKGVIQELGRPCCLHGQVVRATRGRTEARAEGQQGVGAPHSTDEAGELAPRGPGGGKGAPCQRTEEGKMSGASKPTNISTKQDRIAKLAEQMPDRALSSLAHHIDIEWLREAHRRTRKDAAPGVDGKTAEDYEQDLEGNLERLLDAAKSGTYRAPPVRRVQIPKGDGKTAAARDPDARGQGPSARGGDGAGTDLREGVPRLLVWVPAGAFGSPSARVPYGRA